MAELTTKTGADVAVEVKRLFGDEDGVQIDDADILRWVNDAQRDIVATNPVLQKRVTRNVVAGTAEYAYPPERIQYIQAILFKGVPLDGLSYPEAQEYIQSNRISGQEGPEPQVWYQWAQNIVIWPTPTQSVANGLTMDYIEIPNELASLADLLSLPDRYFNTIVDTVMMKAHLLDEDLPAADFARMRYSEGLSKLSEQENAIRRATYPTMTVLSEDL